MKKLIKTLIERYSPLVKEKINELAQEAIKKLKVRAENYNYSQQIDKAIDFIMDKIKLPLWLKPFKKVIRNIIEDTLTELVEEGKEKLLK